MLPLISFGEKELYDFLWYLYVCYFGNLKEMQDFNNVLFGIPVDHFCKYISVAIDGKNSFLSVCVGGGGN